MKVNKHLVDLAKQDSEELYKTADWYNPVHWVLGDPETKKKWKRQRDQDQLKALVATGGIAAALPFFVKALRSKATSEEQKRRNDLLQRAAVMNSPVLNIDSSSLDDPRIERIQQQDQKQEEGSKSSVKTAAEFPSLWDTLTAPVEGGAKVLGLGQKGKSWTYPALAVMALAAGAGAGWKWADKEADDKRKEQLDEMLAQAKQKLDDTQFKALAQQRGIPYETVEKQAQDQTLMETMSTAAPQLLPLYALILGYGGYKAGQHLADQSSPRTQAYKDLKKSIEHQVKNPDKPAELYLSSNSDMRQLFGPTTSKERKKRQEEIPASSLTVDV